MKFNDEKSGIKLLIEGKCLEPKLMAGTEAMRRLIYMNFQVPFSENTLFIIGLSSSQNTNSDA